MIAGMSVNGIWRVLRHALLVGLMLGLNTLATAQDLKDLDKVKADGVLKVGLYNRLLPFSDQGKGLDMDIAEALASKLGVKARALPFDADDNLIDDLRNMVWRGSVFGYGPSDVMMHVPFDDQLSRREDKVLFFGPYYREEIFVARNLKRLPELDSLMPFSTGQFKIGAEVASISSEVLAGADRGMYVNNLTNFKTAQEAVSAMLRGELDAVMATRAELEAALHGQPNADQYAVTKVRHNSLPAQGWPVGMAVKAANKNLALALKQALEELRSTGELERLFAKYGVRYVRP